LIERRRISPGSAPPIHAQQIKKRETFRRAIRRKPSCCTQPGPDGGQSAWVGIQGSTIGDALKIETGWVCCNRLGPTTPRPAPRAANHPMGSAASSDVLHHRDRCTRRRHFGARLRQRVGGTILLAERLASSRMLTESKSPPRRGDRNGGGSSWSHGGMGHETTVV
jgi:hypothetical protein